MVTLAIVVLFIFVASIRLLYNHVRLNTIPGPVLAGLSEFWLQVQSSSQLASSLLQLHEKYGTIVRIGPDLVSVSNPAAIVPIYTRRPRNRLKYDIQYPATCHVRPTETVCSTPSNAHQYEGLIDPALRNLVITLRRHHTLDLTSFLHFFAADFLSRLNSAGPAETNDTRRREPTERRLPGFFAEHLIFRGPISRLKRQHGFPFICREVRPHFTGRPTSISSHTLLRAENHPSPMEEHLDCIAKTFVLTFHFLLKYPAVMRKVRREIAAAHNHNTLSRLPLWSELGELKYLQAVMKESLRLSHVHRVHEVKSPAGGVTVSGYYVPQGTKIRCHPLVVHNNAQIYGDRPQVFDPERWLTNDLQRQKRMMECLMLFQQHVFENPTICAAWWELKKAIVVVLMKFNLELCTAYEAAQDSDRGSSPPLVAVRFIPRS